MHRVELGRDLGLLLQAHLLDLLIQARAPGHAPGHVARRVHLGAGLAHARVLLGAAAHVPGEDHGRSRRPADHRGERARERGDPHPVVQLAREDHVGAAVIARDHGEEQRTVEADHGASDLGAPLQDAATHRLRGAVEAREVREHDRRADPARGVERARHLLRGLREERAGGPAVRSVVGRVANAGQRATLDADQADRGAAEVRVPDDRGLGAAPAAPALEPARVLVDQGAHQRAHGEGPLASGVGVGREDLGDGRESLLALVGREADVSFRRVARREAPRRRLPGRVIARGVVVEQDRIGLREVARLVVRVAARPHDHLVAADPDLVLGRDPARELERDATREHHRGSGQHDQDAPRLQTHGGERVEVALRAYVDAQQDQVDLATLISELDQAAHHSRSGVEVLGSALHGDARAR